MKKLKIAAAVTGLAAVALPFISSAAIVSVPQYSDVVNTTSTAFAQSLVTDLLPWAAAFIAIIVGAMALVAIYHKLVSGAARLFGGRRRRYGRRRR